MDQNSSRAKPALVPGRLLTILDPLVILITAPGVVFAANLPGKWIAMLAALLLLPFILRIIAIRRLSLRNPANKPLGVILLLAIPVSVWASPMLREVSVPMLAYLVWSIALFFAIINWVASPWGNSKRRLANLVWLYLFFGLAMMIIGLLGPKWSYSYELLNAVSNVPPVLANEESAHAGFFQNNEIAGVLILFAPLSVALLLAPASALRSGEDARFLEFFSKPKTGRLKILLTYHLPLAVMALLFFIGIVLTRSRGGVLSIIASVLLVFLLMGKRGIPWLVLAVVTLIMAFLFLGEYGFSSAVLNTGINQRLSLSDLLTGRPSIWNSAWHGISDFKLTGMGLGTFGQAMFHVYPSKFNEFLEDAHNFFLQTALDLGIAGFIAMLWLLASVLYSLFLMFRRNREKLLQRHWAIGVLGSLTAFLLYSLTDSVSLGTPGNTALWFLLGLAAASISLEQSDHLKYLEPENEQDNGSGFWKELLMLYGAREVRRKLKTRNRFIRFLFPRPRRYAFGGIALTVGLIVSLVFLISLPGLVRYNLATREALRAYFSDPSLRVEAEEKLAAASARHCGAYWLLGKLAEADGDQTRRNEAWIQLLQCAPDFNEFIYRTAPASRELAAAMVENQPDSPEGYFWMAELRAEGNRDEAILLLRKGLELDPENGYRWCHLGDLLVNNRETEAAIEAYLNCCYFGDPGSNGCWRAGIYAERLGRPRDAIRYYRRSRWQGAHKRAAELERELLQSQ